MLEQATSEQEFQKKAIDENKYVMIAPQKFSPNMNFPETLYKLDLSGNYLEELPQNIGNLKSLRILFLHFNLIKQEQFINQFKNSALNYLTIFNNPIASSNGIRGRIVRAVTSLWAIDFNSVSIEEKYDTLLHESSSFKMMSQKSKVQWPLVLDSNQNQISIFWIELNIIRTAYQKLNFTLIIQRYYRGYRQRKYVKAKAVVKELKQNVALDVVIQWKKFVSIKKELREILLAQYRPQFIQILNNYRIFKKRKQEIYVNANASKIIFRSLKQNFDNFKHFYEYLNVEKFQYFYFQRTQIKLFLSLLDKTSKYLENNYYFRNNKSVEGIIQFIKLNSFDNNPERNTSRYLHQSNIKAIRLPHQNEQFPCKFLFTSFIKPKVLKVLYTNEKIAEQKFLVLFQQRVKVKQLRQQKATVLTETQREKYGKTLEKINTFQKDYQQLMEAFFPNKTLIKIFLKTVYLHNKRISLNKLENEEQFHLYFDFQLRKINSILMIQKNYRTHHLVRKIGTTMDWVMQMLNKQRSIFLLLFNIFRAVFVIQRWLRRLKENHRASFFKEIAFKANIICSRTLYLLKDIYMNIKQVTKASPYKIKFLEQDHKITVDPVRKITRLVMDDSIQEDDFGMKKHKAILTEIKKQRIKSNFEGMFFLHVPSQSSNVWDLNQLMRNSSEKEQIPLYELFKYFKKKDHLKFSELISPHEKQPHNGDLLFLLHCGSRIKWLTLAGRDYISFTYDSIQEARYRMMSLALNTYRFNQNGIFIWLFGDEIWEAIKLQGKRTLNELEAYYEKVQKIYDLKFSPQSSQQIKEQPINQSGDTNYLFLFSSFNKSFLDFSQDLPVEASSIPSKLFITQDQKSQVIAGDLLWVLSPTKYLFDSEWLEGLNRKRKINNNMEVQYSTQEDKLSINMMKQSMEMIFNMPIQSKELSSYSTTLPQKFSIVSLNSQDIPEFEQSTFRSKRNPNLFSKQLIDQSVMEAAQQEQIQLQQQNNIIVNVRENQEDFKQNKDILIQDFLKEENNSSKIQQQKLQKSLLKEIRIAERMINLSQVKSKAYREKIYIQQQTEQVNAEQLQRKREVIKKIQGFSSVRHQQLEETDKDIQAKIEIGANFIVKQEKIFNFKKTQFLNQLKRSEEMSRQNQSVDNKERKYIRAFNITSDLLPLAQTSKNQTFSQQEQPNTERINSYYFPQINSTVQTKLIRSKRDIMFNKKGASFQHQYRHSVFPEEFYPLNQGLQIQFPS